MKPKNILPDDDEPEDDSEEYEETSLIEMIKTLNQNQINLQKQIQTLSLNQASPQVIQLGDLVLSSPYLKLTDLSKEATKLLDNVTVKSYLKDFKLKKISGSIPSYLE